MPDNGVSVIIPVFNDREALERAIPESIDALSGITGAFEILVAEDGSTDGSADLVRNWHETDPRVILLHADERLGRGRALNRAIKSASYGIVCYYDVDLATDIAHLPDLVGAIRDGADIATGSRLMPDSSIVRSGGREIASRGYNLLVRTILRSRLYDHQCGFKAFRRDRILTLIPEVQAPHWFWDTEVLVRGQRKGWRVAEFPVVWNEGPGTTVRFKDVFSMGSQIIGLWWQLHVAKG
ncbi:dolichyl-phosphate beta-glucosyltransferase [Methanofollis fontis]|uniref:Glycosyl transferase n=1 Tax=Methanofollis fontis TaxID=2052832 RepID=A0A483CSW7_9EURY|nr:dolichyl-phosphate beta-glucosyltransferase [Methanofollis fontis]TAJ44205.1 glycosyl transferase [Methanofollis fontis]